MRFKQRKFGKARICFYHSQPERFHNFGFIMIIASRTVSGGFDFALRSACTCTTVYTICDQLWQLGLLCVKVERLLGDVEGYPWAVF